MKKKHTLTAALVMLFAGSMMSQSVSFYPGTSVTRYLEPNQYSLIYLDILNKTTDSLDIDWSLVSNNLVSGWDYSLCDFGTCYIGVPQKGTMKRMGISDTAFLKLNISPQQVLGTGSVTFKVSPTPNESYNVTITVVVYPSAILENAAFESVSIYPNPAKDIVTIENSFAQHGNISIYNVIGEKLVDFVASPGEKSNISFTSLPAGLYFVKYTHSLGEVITKKIVKN